MLEHADLRPYFKEGKPIVKDDLLYNKAALMAELQLSIIDAVLAFPISFAGPQVSTFDPMFVRAFRESSVMCEFLQKRQKQYHMQTVEIAKNACQLSKPW